MTFINAYWTGVLIQTGIMLIGIVGVSLLTGFTGIFSMGQAGFMCIGAYVSALSVKVLSLPIWMGVVLGIFASMIFGLIIGLPTLRLRGDYFLIASIGIGEAVRLIIENTYSITGGATGLLSIGKVNSLELILAIDVVVVVFAVCFLNSKFGRNCVAIREDETAATAMGIDVFRTKLLVFLICCGLCALSGALLGHYLNYVSPRVFTARKSSELVMTVIMGGGGSLTGSLLAGLILTPLPELLRTDTAQEWRMAIYGTLLVIVIMFRPNGLMGNKELSFKTFISHVRKIYRQRKAKGAKHSDE